MQKTILASAIIFVTVLVPHTYGQTPKSTSQPGIIYSWDCNASMPQSEFVKVEMTHYTQLIAEPEHYVTYDRFIGLRPDGSITQWESPWIEVNEEKSKSSEPPTGTGYQDIACTTSYNIAINSNGTLIDWGYHSGHWYYGPLPEGTFQSISCYKKSVAGVKTDGTIVSWGVLSIAPPTGNDFTNVVVGDSRCVALRTDGSIAATGDDAANIPAGNNFIAIAAGSQHNLALKSDGSIVAWGDNSYGQTDVPSGNNYIAIDAGRSHSVALRNDGTIVIWGSSADLDPSKPKDCSASVTGIAANSSSEQTVALHRIDYNPLILTSQNGGETWTAGTTQTITWESESPNHMVEIWLLKDNQPVALIDTTPVTDGSYNWRIPEHMNPGTDYAIQLNWTNPCGFTHSDKSDSSFSILADTPIPTVTVNSPNGGEVWAANSTQTITWNSTNPTGMVELWHYWNNEPVCQMIGITPMSAGRYDWNIPSNFAGTNGLVVAHWSNGTFSIQDSSDAEYEITAAPAPQLTITRPVGSENWLAGTTETITWNANFTEGLIDVNLHNDTSSIHLGTAEVSAGSFTWDICPTIPNNSDYVIALTEQYLGIESASNEFRIQQGSANPILTITSPTTSGEHDQWAAGTVHTITWTSENLNGDLEIVLPDTMGINWGHVVVPISSGQYTWSIPANTTLGLNDITIRSTDCGIPVTASAIVNIVEPTAALTGDIDGDGDIDLRDLAALQACFTGDNKKLLTPPCVFFDFDPDADIDLSDFFEVNDALTGP